MITENVSTLKIHKLTQSQYDRELAAGNIEENALYLTPDDYNAMSANNPTGTGSFSLNRGEGEIGDLSIAIGDCTIASGVCSYAEGFCTESSGEASHAEGSLTCAGSLGEVRIAATSSPGDYAHAEGYGTWASGGCSHAEGDGTQADGFASHSEGRETQAMGDYAHSQGYQTEANGKYSSAGGYQTRATGLVAHAVGSGLLAKNYQTVFGKYNEEKNGVQTLESQANTQTVFMVGVGTPTTPLNGFRVKADGTCMGSSAFVGSGADFAEYFEWADGNPNNEDRRGRIVTLEGDKIRLANKNDGYLLGVVSTTGAFIGNSASENWQGKYLKDVFGEWITEQVAIPESIDEETGKTIPAYTVTQYVVNPNYNPEEEYISREFRKEWSPIGFHGQLIVVDDGTCEVNGYCTPSTNGIATQSEIGYRVMKRVDDTHIKVLVK